MHRIMNSLWGWQRPQSASKFVDIIDFSRIVIILTLWEEPQKSIVTEIGVYLLFQLKLPNFHSEYSHGHAKDYKGRELHNRVKIDGCSNSSCLLSVRHNITLLIYIYIYILTTYTADLQWHANCNMVTQSFILLSASLPACFHFFLKLPILKYFVKLAVLLLSVHI
jgi:hypothetical protein